ncbi:ribonuclease H-like domain-containing protein [Tanacetum coccineum]
MPPTPDLSFTGLDEFVNEPVVENCKAMSSEEKPKIVKKNDDALIIKEWVSDYEEEDASQPKIEKKTVRPRLIHKWITGLGVNDCGCSWHLTWENVLSYNYEEIDRGYVPFGGKPKEENSQTMESSTEPLVSIETSGILKSFITGIENLVDHKVKVIRCDNGTEFKNREMNQFCEMKGILRQFSVARTPQQNGVAKRRNRTLIEAARTMLADSKLPTTFWAEAVNIACYVQNRVLVVKPHNKTPYELFHGRTPTLSFMRPFGCPITILNTIDHIGKFDGKADEGFFVGYSLNSKAFRNNCHQFARCVLCSYQVNPKVLHLHAVKRIFKYLKGQPKLGLWYPKDYPFDLVAYTDSDYARASLDIKSTTEGKVKKGVKLMMEKLFRMELELLLPSDPSKNVVDEAVHKELGDSLVRAATTASSLEAEQDSGNITKTRYL